MNSGKPSMWCLVRGPIMLITLGVLFAVDQLGSYSFWRTWPVLVILFGVLKLLEKVFSGGAAGQSYPTQGGAQ